jgi:ComF family protein
MKNRLLAFGKASLNLVYPLSCCACGAKMSYNTGLCGECLSGIKLNEHGVAACRYEGVLKNAIHQFKYGGLLALIAPFTGLMSGFADKHIDMDRIDAIVPVPLHPVKLRERGFNQAYLLGRALGKQYDKPVLNRGLVKTRVTEPQSSLNRSRRLKNLKGAFYAGTSPGLSGKNILLIDDVLTTGATVSEAVRAARKAGASSVKVLALAKGI